MDPLAIVLVPGFLGGVALAIVFIRLQQRRQNEPEPDAFRDAPSADVINIARIRVAGIGGLGLVAMALTVAWFVPPIRLALVVGLALGVVFGGVLILSRRRSGSMPSSGRQIGANTTLAIDAQPPAATDDRPRSELRRRPAVGTAAGPCLS
jgi:hypothetical protein